MGFPEGSRGWWGGLPNLGPWALFLGFTLEGMGFPVAYEFLFALLGLLVFRGKISFLVAVLLAATGNLLGNSAGYAIGYWGGPLFIEKYGRYIKIKEGDLSRVKRWAARYGAGTLFIFRWIGFGLTLVNWFLGYSRFSYPRFALVSAITSLLWAGAWIFFIERVSHLSTSWLLPPRYALPLILLVVASSLFFLARYLFRRMSQEDGNGARDEVSG
ncbi:MAG: DedA family protein [Firmicutes bacterium]|nr:DedA family protein [Bacillota bacterium]MCL5039495.1 DedA family protein [Bacillota bacterium]